MSVVYLLGHPVAHSLSPAMQNAAFAAVGLPHRYEALDIGPNDLGALVARIASGEVLGANVTIPYKETVMPLAQAWDGTALAVQAANTLARHEHEGRSWVQAWNTDGGGFQVALQQAGIDVAARATLVLGAGGAARAVLYMLLSGGAHVRLANRSRARADLVVASVAGVNGERASAVSWDARLDLSGVDLVVNATSLGLHGDDPLMNVALEPPLTIVDLVPTAAPTPLIRRARAAGLAHLDGLPMLLHQGAMSFKLWTGKDAPLDAMRRALRSN
ncbi:MAG TPA: shikimate dehydrogenase [Candidatus Limnocylindria bacterium]|nr:shikimate dehydrogenase [Candidatus Limnocylindria bacterium]